MDINSLYVQNIACILCWLNTSFKLVVINKIELSEPTQWISNPLSAWVFAAIVAEEANGRVLFFLSKAGKEKL